MPLCMCEYIYMINFFQWNCRLKQELLKYWWKLPNCPPKSLQEFTLLPGVYGTTLLLIRIQALSVNVFCPVHLFITFGNINFHMTHRLRIVQLFFLIIKVIHSMVSKKNENMKIGANWATVLSLCPKEPCGTLAIIHLLNFS